MSCIVYLILEGKSRIPFEKAEKSITFETGKKELSFMKEKIQQYWKAKPLQVIMIMALLVRLLAAVLSQGYVMHDDHFLVIEASQS